jgi:peptidoglycan/LPS O-acetylase OafA/YrhL
MLGTFRFVLAVLVALSHADLRVAGLNPGVVAVVCFYLISGYVMTGLIRSHYATIDRIPYFYIDRALRIFPQYLVIAGLTLAWFWMSGTQTYFLRHAPGWSDFLANVTIVPLNFYMFNGTDAFTLIPPAWSLGAEVQFYALIPFILLLSLFFPLLAMAFVVLAMAISGMLNTELYGYRLLPGVLVYFLIGTLLYDARADAKRRKLLIFGLLSLLLVGVGCMLYFSWQEFSYNKETWIGLAIGIPVLYWLGNLPQNAIDNRLGDLSYGVFLNHFLIQWAIVGKPVELQAWGLYILASVMLSALTQIVVERPALRLRKRFRKAGYVVDETKPAI